MGRALYDGVKDIPGDHGDSAWVGMRSLDGFYQRIVDELWDEMFSTLAVLGSAGGYENGSMDRERQLKNQSFGFSPGLPKSNSVVERLQVSFRLGIVRSCFTR